MVPNRSADRLGTTESSPNPSFERLCPARGHDCPSRHLTDVRRVGSRPTSCMPRFQQQGCGVLLGAPFWCAWRVALSPGRSAQVLFENPSEGGCRRLGSGRLSLAPAPLSALTLVSGLAGGFRNLAELGQTASGPPETIPAPKSKPERRDTLRCRVGFGNTLRSSGWSANLCAAAPNLPLQRSNLCSCLCT